MTQIFICRVRGVLPIRTINFQGRLTLRQALKESKNSVSVYLMKEIGNVASVKNLVGNLGIDKKRYLNILLFA
ncbi:MAG: hypothetical protein IPG00_22380 [Saprospiraceae bacterium]|nr:hypothetical protein [Saprospiraceae bacterium]